MSLEVASRIVQQRRAQGLPERVQDREALRRLASLLVAARNQRKEVRHGQEMVKA